MMIVSGDPQHAVSSQGIESIFPERIDFPGDGSTEGFQTGLSQPNHKRAQHTK
jgi:hypothetical protein